MKDVYKIIFVLVLLVVINLVNVTIFDILKSNNYYFYLMTILLLSLLIIIAITIYYTTFSDDSSPEENKKIQINDLYIEKSTTTNERNLYEIDSNYVYDTNSDFDITKDLRMKKFININVVFESGEEIFNYFENNKSEEKRHFTDFQNFLKENNMEVCTLLNNKS